MRKVAILFLAVTILLLGYGFATAEIKSEGPKVLKVKGLYLGMDIDEACKILKAFLGESDKAGERRKFEYLKPDDSNKSPRYAFAYLKEETMNPYGRLGYTHPTMIVANSDKKVSVIYIDQHDVKKLFNTDGISVEDFVREFIKAYNISSMDPFFDNEPISEDFKITQGWGFISANGYRVLISEDGALFIQTIPKKSEFKFN